MGKIKGNEILKSSEEAGVYVTYEDIKNLSPYASRTEEITLKDKSRKVNIEMFFTFSEDNGIFLTNNLNGFKRKCNAAKIAENLLKCVQKNTSDFWEEEYFVNLRGIYTKEFIKESFVSEKKVYEELKLNGIGAIFSDNLYVDFLQSACFEENYFYAYNTVAELDVSKIEHLSVIFITEDNVVTLRDVKECETIKKSLFRYRFRNGEMKIFSRKDVEIKKALLDLEKIQEPKKFKNYAFSILEQNKEEKKSKEFLNDLELF